MKKYLLIAACLFTAISCTEQVTEIAGEGNNTDNGIIAGSSYERALGVANMAPELFAASITKSLGKRVADGIVVVSDNAATKSGVADTLMYVFNYAGDDGYVIVPNDERKGFVLAYSDRGNFDIADTAINAVARYVVRSAIDYCETPTEEFTETKDALGDLEFKKYGKVLKPYKGNGCRALRPVDSYHFDMPGPLGPPDSYYETTGCTAKLDIIYLVPEGVDPLVTTRWGQEFPYNLKAPVIDGKNTVAGCVATAASQIIAYHAFPEKYPAGTYIQGYYYGDTDTKLTELKKYRGGAGSANPGPGVRDYVSRLFRVVGDQVGMKWGVYESSALFTNLPDLFKWLGYTGVQKNIEYYTLEKVKGSLNNGYPVIVCGSDTSVPNGGEHAYIIDGYQYMYSGYVYCYFDEHGTFFKRDDFVTPSGTTQTYVHINFGWNGNYDGYYQSGVFDTSDNDHRFETKSNYNGALYIIPYIHP